MLSIFSSILCRRTEINLNNDFNVHYDICYKNYKKTASLIKRIENIYCSDQFSNQLLEIIKGKNDSSLKSKILSIRRKLYTNKEIHDKEIEILLSLNISNRFRYFLEMERKLRKLKSQRNDLYNKEFQITSNSLITLFKDERLQSGLLQSSSLVYIEFKKRFKDENFSNIKINNKIRNLIFTLYKYYGRATYKTSPFSTFGNLGIIKLSDKNDKIKLDKKKKILNPNNYIYLFLVEILIFDPVFRNDQLLLLNPSIKIEDEHLLFFFYREYEEIFQKIKINKLIQSILDVFNQKNFVSWVYLKEFIQINFNLNNKEAVDTLSKLIDLGLLDFRIRDLIFSIDWVKDLYKTTSNKKFKNRPNFDLVNEILFNLNKVSTNQYLVEKRSDLNTEIVKKLNLLILNYKDSTVNKFVKLTKPESIFFEDSYFYSNRILEKSIINPAIETLNKLTKQLNSISFSVLQMEYYIDFFYKNYTKSCEINLTKFYFDYQNIYKNNSPKNLNQELIVEIEEKVLLFLLKPVFEDSNEIHYCSSDLNLKLSQIDNFEYDSFSAFIQLEFFKNSNYAVVNNKQIINTGFGKYQSRFLKGFNPNFLKDLKNWNKEIIHKDILYAEINDWSPFNANSHELIFDLELKSPNSATYSSLDQHKIYINDLLVYYDSNYATLKIKHKESNKRVELLDLGFQSPHSRSKFFQFLFPFTKNKLVSLEVFQKILIARARKSNLKSKIYFFKRIVFDKSVVLGRKTWIISNDIIPKQETGSEYEYFHHVNDWIEKYKLPKTAFIKFYFQFENISGKKQNEKPQFIDFKSSISVMLFRKSLNPQSNFLYMEEVLPDFNKTKRDDKNHINEYLIQWHG